MTEVKKMGDSEKTKSGSGSLLVFVFAVVDVAIGAWVSLTTKFSALIAGYFSDGFYIPKLLNFEYSF